MQDWRGVEIAWSEKCRRRMKQAAGAAAIFALCGALQACASDPDWPTTSKITDIGTVMTPEEREKAVQDLKKNDTGHSAGTTAPSAKQSQ